MVSACVIGEFSELDAIALAGNGMNRPVGWLDR
jgi:hypothetical protein